MNAYPSRVHSLACWRRGRSSHPNTRCCRCVQLCTILVLRNLYAVSQGLANMVATFSPGTETDNWSDGLRDMLQDGICAGGQNHVSNQKAQVITKYMLLQRLSAALKCAPWHVVPPSRVQSKEQIHAKMKLVLNGAERWPGIFKTMQDHFTSMDNAQFSSFKPPAPRALTTTQGAHLRALKILSGARISSRQSDYSIVETNVQQVAFMVHWHSTVSSSMLRVRIVWLNSHFSAQPSISPRIQGFFPAALRRHRSSGIPVRSRPGVRWNGHNRAGDIVYGIEVQPGPCRPRITIGIVGQSAWAILSYAALEAGSGMLFIIG